MPRRSTFSLSVGALVRHSLSAYLRNFLPFTLLATLALSPWIALRCYLEGSAIHRGVDVLLSLFQQLLTFVLTGAVTFGVVQQMRGQPAGIGPALSRGLQSFFGVLSTGLLCGIRIFLWSLLLWVPGIVESVKLYVAIPAAVMENKVGSEAISRSERLTDGSRWPIFGGWLVILLVPILTMMGLGFALAAGNDDEELRLPLWIELGIAVLFNTLAATMAAVCYFLLRQGRENVDPKQLAAVFD